MSPEIIENLIGVLVWPIVFLIVVLVMLFRYPESIADFISRLINFRGGPSGFEFRANDKQSMEQQADTIIAAAKKAKRILVQGKAYKREEAFQVLEETIRETLSDLTKEYEKNKEKPELKLKLVVCQIGFAR